MGGGFQHMDISGTKGHPIHEYGALDMDYKKSFRSSSHTQDDINSLSDDAAKSAPNSLGNFSSSEPTHLFRRPIRQHNDLNTGGHVSQVVGYGTNAAMNGGLAVALPLQPGSPQDLPLGTYIRNASQTLQETPTFAEFRFFQDLPDELRLIIWNMAVERTVHLRISENANSFQYDIYTDNNDHRAIIWSCFEASKAIANKYKKLSKHRQCQNKPVCFGPKFEVLHIEGKLKSAWQLTKIIRILPDKDIFETISISHTETWLDNAGYDSLAFPPLVLLFKNLKTVYITIPEIPWKKGYCCLHNGPCSKIGKGGLCFPIDRSVEEPSFQSSVQNMKEKVEQFLDDFNIKNKTNIIFVLSLKDEQTGASFAKPLPAKTRLPFVQSTEHKEWAATEAKKKARKAAAKAEKAKEDGAKAILAKVAKETEPLTRDTPPVLNSWSTFNNPMAYDTAALVLNNSLTASSPSASNSMLATNTRPASNTPLAFKTPPESGTDQYHNNLDGDMREDPDYFIMDFNLCNWMLEQLGVKNYSSAALENTQNT